MLSWSAELGLGSVIFLTNTHQRTARVAHVPAHLVAGIHHASGCGEAKDCWRRTTAALHLTATLTSDLPQATSMAPKDMHKRSFRLTGESRITDCTPICGGNFGCTLSLS